MDLLGVVTGNRPYGLSQLGLKECTYRNRRAGITGLKAEKQSCELISNVAVIQPTQGLVAYIVT